MESAALQPHSWPMHSLEHLPEHLLVHCLEPLDHRGLLAAAAVSREWRRVAQCERLWMRRYMGDFQPSGPVLGSRSGSSNLGCPAARPFAAADEQVPAGPLGASGRWRRAYRQRLEAEANWRAGRCAWGRLDGHRDYIRCAQLQGAKLATCSGSYMHRDCSIRLWDIESGACLEHLAGHGGPIWSMHYDGRRVASCDDEGGVRLWDLASHRVGVSAALAPHSLKCIGLDEQQLVVSGESGLLGLWSLRDVQRALEDADTAPGTDGEMDEAADPDQPRLPSWQPVALDGDGGVWAARARAPQAPGAGLSPDTSCLQVEGGLCAAGDSGPSGQVHLWSTEDDELEYRQGLPGHARGVSTLSFQRETGWLVAGSGAGPVKLWSLERGALLHDLRGHSADVLCHQQAGAQLATGAADCSLRLWDLRCGRAQHVVALGSFPYCLQMDDRRLVAGCSNGTVQVVELRRPGGAAIDERELQAQAVLPVHRERVWALALSESRLVSASLDATIVVRSFQPSDVACQEGGWLDCSGDLEGSDSEGSQAEEEEEEEEEDSSDEGSVDWVENGESDEAPSDEEEAGVEGWGVEALEG